MPARDRKQRQQVTDLTGRQFRLARPDTGTGRNPFGRGEVPPPKVAWLHPLQLVRTGYHAVLSTLATGFLDRRETFAALPEVRVSQETSAPHADVPACLVAAGGAPSGPRHLALRSTLNHTPIWIDFLADIGDSWDATFATASTLAQPHLKVLGLVEELPRAHILVLGGDEVYPTPNRNAYRTRTRSALMAALPDTSAESRCDTLLPTLLAVPGNHDWYDGLTAFVREFCQGRKIGGWKLVQGRSYFAVRLHRDWWLFGIDIALDSRIDETQLSYFEQLLASEPGARRIILCTAKPVWLGGPFRTTEAYRNLAEFADIIRSRRGETTVIVAGDTHHYSRYSSDCVPAEHMIVCGGGGAYLAATHQIPKAVLKVTHEPSESPVDGPSSPGAATLEGTSAVAESSNTGDTKAPEGRTSQQARRRRDAEQRFFLSPFTYPPSDVSRRLTLGALRLAFDSQNWTFVLTVGLLYSLFVRMLYKLDAARQLMSSPASLFDDHLKVLLQALPWPAVFAGTAIVLGCAAFTWYANKGHGIMRLAWGAAHGLLHMAGALWLLAWFIDLRHRIDLHALGGELPGALQFLPVDLVVWRVAYLLVAGVLGATLFGVFLVISDRLMHWHTNEAFLAQAIIDYRSVLRMKLSDDGALTIYPIGIRRVPRRWRARSTTEEDIKRRQREWPSLFEPGDGILRAHLIEAPIEIAAPPSRV